MSLNQPIQSMTIFSWPIVRLWPLTRSYQILVARLLLIAAAIGLWELAARWFVDPALLAPPTDVVHALFSRILADPKIRIAIAVTIAEVSIAYVLAIVFGTLTGLAIGSMALGRSAMMPIIMALYAIPNMVLLPVFTLVLGVSPVMKVAYAFSSAIFPLMICVIGTMRNINQLYVRAAVSMGASRSEIIRHVVFPHMVPGFFTGLRLAMVVTMLGVVGAELYVSANGIGFFTRMFSEVYDPAPLFALILTLAVISVTLNESIRMLERRATRWREG